ncbi:mediator complex, subunit Med11 [Sphaerosporella brunnea]|uniref:Mediator of RNA polymerase II transcription subunit 11 n=1 Tax=Sphaerosporella brunnea TaxID=1250544 RepID=A0A5J5EZQ1_9PEZI|nr:mediator complex, subunit Med11 [Sphaerosporella brunnea]
MPSPTAATAIQDLSNIDTDISALLSSASKALQCLSSPPTPGTDPTEEFRAHAEEYHRLLSSITVRLRRQIVQLQAAEIPVVSGTIDVGVLNSRNDVVGREMEAELWAEARGFLEGAVDAQRGTAGMEVEVDS